MSDSNKKELLFLFLKEVEEYQKIIDIIPLEQKQEQVFINADKENMAKINIRAVFLRKFISRPENVHIAKIVKYAQEIIPWEFDNLQKIYDSYVERYESDYIQVDSKGKEFNLRETFDDVVYGFYLHADINRVQRLNDSTDTARYVLMKEFVNLIEDTLFQLYEVIKQENCSAVSEESFLEKAPVIRKKEFKKVYDALGGYWDNLDADKLVPRKVRKIWENWSQEDIAVYSVGVKFLENVYDNKTAEKDMQDIVFQPTKTDWDFEELTQLVKKKEYGISSSVKYNKNKDVAYLKVLPNVDEGFIVEREQLIPADSITLVKDPEINQWRVFAFGGVVEDPFNRS